VHEPLIFFLSIFIFDEIDMTTDDDEILMIMLCDEMTVGVGKLICVLTSSRLIPVNFLFLRFIFVVVVSVGCRYYSRMDYSKRTLGRDGNRISST
jgi:hypothetical protein